MLSGAEPLVLAVALLATGGVRGTGVFDYRASSEFRFSSTDSVDVLTAEIVGTSCETAMVRIEITTARKDVAYRFVGELDRFIPCSYLEDHGSLKDELCQRLVDGVVTEGIRRRTSGLESVAELKAQPLGGCLTAPDYESIRRKDLPTLCHTTANEHMVCVAWDMELAKIVAVMTCSE